MVLMLIGYVPDYIVYCSGIYRECAIAILPVKVFITSTLCFYPFGRMAFYFLYEAH